MAPDPSEAGYSTRSRRLVQVVAGLGSAVAPFQVASVIVAAPTIGLDFGTDVALLGWLTAAFFLASAAFLVPFGRIADVKGAKRVFALGMAVYIASAAVCALAPDIYVLIAGRALTGLGAAMVFGTSIALLSLVFPTPERGKAIGVNVTAMFGGFTAGLLAGGLLTFYLSWRYLFLVALVIALVTLVLLRLRVKGECELARVREYDPRGMVLYSIGLLLAFFGLSEIDSLLGLVMLVAGGAVLGAFRVWEGRQAHPLVNRAVARERNFRLAVLTNVSFQAGAFAIPFLLSLYFQLVGGLDARTAGLVLVLPQALMTGFGTVSGRMTVRYSNYAVAGLGCIINAAGVGLLLTIETSVSLLIPIISLSLVGIGTGIFMPAVVNWALSKVAREDYGVASALTETSRLAGMTFSNVVLIVVFGLFLGGTAVGAESASAFLEAVRGSSFLYLILSLASTAVCWAMVLKGRASTPRTGDV